MWFDATRALAEMRAATPATSATTATMPPKVAVVAVVAAPHPRKTETVGPDFRHGSFMGDPKTWTGRVVSLAEWRDLTAWDRHGSTGKVWNGLTRAWEPMQAEKGPAQRPPR